jgi:signal transduction histidine kinase
VTGGVIGFVGHSLGRRARIIVEERRRSDGLRRRLEKVQREQAVWVMVASVLHEIHNPLHSLGLLLDELGEDPGAATSLVPRARTQIERVVAQLRTLRALPAMARPAQGPVDLNALVAALDKDIAPLARARRVNFHVVASPREGSGLIVQGDAAYIRIILENLVHNGLDALDDAAPQARRLEIVLSEDAHDAYVRVSDGGPGIRPDLRARVFEPLGTTKQSGLGLGLPIARALARAMGGDLVLDPGPGGASFLLSLPRAESLAA